MTKPVATNQRGFVVEHTSHYDLVDVHDAFMRILGGQPMLDLRVLLGESVDRSLQDYVLRFIDEHTQRELSIPSKMGVTYAEQKGFEVKAKKDLADLLLKHSTLVEGKRTYPSERERERIRGEISEDGTAPKLWGWGMLNQPRA